MPLMFEVLLCDQAFPNTSVKRMARFRSYGMDGKYKCIWRMLMMQVLQYVEGEI